MHKALLAEGLTSGRGRSVRPAATEAVVTRVRTALEASRGYVFGHGIALQPSLELGLRRDGGGCRDGQGRGCRRKPDRSGSVDRPVGRRAGADPAGAPSPRVPGIYLALRYAEPRVGRASQQCRATPGAAPTRWPAPVTRQSAYVSPTAHRQPLPSSLPYAGSRLGSLRRNPRTPPRV